jgi:ubiquinone/menaquinone biosynthesis C-methylase UbiE
VLADLDSKLPFLDNYFDKIVCNLVLSYVRHPQKTLDELYRILAPGGTLVITTLKPYADLSAVYRNFLAQADTPEEVAEARNLLANAGLIRARESEGHFKFFGEIELMGMMLELGATHPVVSRSFANQANVAAMIKNR